ncbi:MAG TPA: outer membrane protein assembly factor BamD [Bryobacteraceae bacterium]|nr:outer membrane protein assembly factor BamD [Bryobacteraceae bacterium]
MARYIPVAILLAGLLTSCGFHRKKYEDPITKDTKQPDKVLFDKAINDIEHGRYEIARITLNTMINTYDQSEYLAKAKLAVADSWYREGGVSGLAQAEAEYKDFILFYPTMQEAAESQEKICLIHYRQMEKADRDQSQALRAEDECRQLIVQFPNSKYVPQAQQLLRNIQEAIGEGEFLVGDFYFKHGDNSAAAGRMSHLIEQYPLYSKADMALWEEAQAYSRLGNRFRKQEGDAYAKIVRDYPLSSFAADATRELKDLELPVPEADPAAVARMQYNKEHRLKKGLIARETGFLRRGPDMTSASQTGAPAMTNLKASVPPLVPQPGGGTAGFTGDVTATTVGNSSALDTKPDARANPPAASGAPASTAPSAATGAAPSGQSQQASAGQTPSADQQTAAQNAKKSKKKNKKQKPPKAQPADSTQGTAPASQGN